MLAPPLQRLVTELAKLPGIGNRTAQRLAFHILRASHEDALALAQAIQDVKDKISPCEICFNLTEGPRCQICLDERRDMSVLCVVRTPMTSSRSSAPTSSAAATTCSAARSRRDRRRRARGPAARPALRAGARDGVREVVLATNPTTTGEATAHAHRRRAARSARRTSPSPGSPRGLPVGGDLEYADEVTLGRAFSGRRTL